MDNNCIETHKAPFSTFHCWLIVLTAALCFFFNLMQITICNTLGSYFTTTFSIKSPVTLGYFTAVYLYATMIFLFPAGILIDKISIKKIAVFFIALSAVSNICLAFTNTLWIAFLFRFLAGVAGAFSFLPCLKLAPMWLSSKKLGSAIGICVTIGMCGGLTAQMPLQWVLNKFGGQSVLLLTGIIGLIIFCLVLFIVKDHPVDSNLEAEVNHSLPLKKGIIKALLNKQTWLASLYIGLINLPIMILGAVWGIKYLTNTHHISVTKASSITSMIFLGSIFGMSFFGWFSDALKSRKQPMFIGAIAATIIILLIIFVPCSNTIWLLALFLLLGFFTSSQVIGYPIVTESNSVEVLGTANALCNIIVFAVASILQPFFGLLIEIFLKYYSLSITYKLTMLSLPICFGISLIYTFILKETFKKN
jgi:sugar phosphate permease